MRKQIDGNDHEVKYKYSRKCNIAGHLYGMLDKKTKL